MQHLGIKQGTLGRVVRMIDFGGEHLTVFIPTNKHFANAKVLDVGDDFFTAHWMSNYNIHGDFRSELMHFDSEAKLNNTDLEARNKIRRENGLQEIQ